MLSITSAKHLDWDLNNSTIRNYDEDGIPLCDELDSIPECEEIDYIRKCELEDHIAIAEQILNEMSQIVIF